MGFQVANNGRVVSNPDVEMLDLKRRAARIEMLIWTCEDTDEYCRLLKRQFEVQQQIDNLRPVTPRLQISASADANGHPDRRFATDPDMRRSAGNRRAEDRA